MPLQSYRSHVKTTLLIAYPVMLSQLGHILVGVADSVMVGALGAEPLAAVSLANGLVSLGLMFGIGVSLAITPLVAAADGGDTTHDRAQIFRHGLVINVVTGLALVALLAASAGVLPWLNQPPRVVELAIPYLIITALSLLPFMFFQTFRQYAEGLSFTRTAMVITLSANLLNVLLNYLLIYGYGSIPALGLNGAGVATLIARVVMAGVMMMYVLRAPWFRWTPLRLRTLQRSLSRRMLRIGVPTGFQYIFEVGAFSFASIMMGWLGTRALAAHQIALNLAAVSYMVATGLAAAATVRVGNQLGRRDMPNLRRVGNSALLMSTVLMGTSAGIFLLLNDTLPTLYVSEVPVIDLAASLLVIAAFFQVSDGVQAVALGILRGMADVKIPTLITLIAYWGVGLPVAYGLAFPLGWGAPGIWVGLLISLTLAAVFLVLRFRRLSTQRVPSGTTPA
ncbi:MAG: MATE family efflux transporter [Tunicatimonas sp.]